MEEAKRGRGRPQTTGRFRSREDLIKRCRFHRERGKSFREIGPIVGVSPDTVRLLLGAKGA